MRLRAPGLLGLLLALQAAGARADELPWRPQPVQPAVAAPAAPVPIRLGRPVPLTQPEAARAVNPVSWSISLSQPGRIVRAQAPDGPPPPVPPPPAGSAVPAFPAPAPAGEEPYNCGVVANNASGGVGGFFTNCWDKTKKWFSDVPSSINGVFQPGPGGRGLFMSDHKFDNFISPVTNPFLFEDPRALTELRPIFMWQQTPSGNPQFHGGNNFWFGTQARVAFTDWFSVVINRLGGSWMDPNSPASPGLFQSHSGFSELWLGPKFTFLRNDSTGTLMAGGLTFQIPDGPARVFQNTGSLSLVPYFSFGQNFLKNFQYGSFNFLNTTGYTFRTDNERSEYFYTNFHLDYDVGNLHRIYPLIELQWFHYTRNGHPQTLGFEGMDLYNFGSNNAGHNDLILAIGGRYKFRGLEWLQMGAAIQWDVIGSGTSRLEDFRMVFDIIIRY